MSILRILRARWLVLGARQDFRESEHLRRLADAYLSRSIARLDVADAIHAAERAALTHRV